ncbi:sterol desaturase/sphingolipid hydroxylase (fatty acid hydroxylase superfamily) [Pedobacter cryoconitis]|uniref:Sterol desaturase/sphingolipid hydroxylase (Fatty acid hydroxylase superfamily) n=1 Tax=Pedobacter cryoconitis TaxID=188932 RepID=A0A7W9DYA4_9SPHI|nr:sterol desaturase family protein [Pedobacter cryoconitis]MBB5634345.1 sterol desaturase/sphingolipid hydroxylase (fatty acid hydroxylase superfamily) [Pedobacter cryoconitis]MBB6272532.1 sterol desaturase/sphingolipid hydroxylase (fatty acid hydroxylase superfamily) [Pedobacter cryoconitis]
MLNDPRNITLSLLFGLLIVISIVEMYISYMHDRKLYAKKDTWTNVYLMGLAFLINISTKTATFFLLDYCYHFRLFEIKNIVVYWIVLVLAQDLLYWILHTSGHYIRFFWAMHVTHHSSELFNLTTGFRSTVFEPLYRVFFYLPLAFMGFSAIDILFAYLVTQLYGNMVHTQAVGKLHPVLEYFLVTPSHHRVHHASNIRYLDKNMGMVLIIWDRMFGTFQEELPEETVVYGLTHQPEDTGPVNIVFHEFKAMTADMKRAPGLMNKLKYMFNPPGWSHDGSTQIAKVMQQELKDAEEKNKIAHSTPLSHHK